MEMSQLEARVSVLQAKQHIVTVEGLLSPAECVALIELAEGIGFTDAPITTGLGPVMDPEVRDNTRVMLDDPKQAALLWPRIEPFIPRTIPSSHGTWAAVGLNERLRFYRYDPGQRFAWHRDGAFVRNSRERSHLTLLLYLNDCTAGGATEIDIDDGLEVKPKAGRALLFAHHVRHQGAPVRSGRKYVLRSDVMYSCSVSARPT